MKTLQINKLEIPVDAPDIPGLTFRKFRGEEDFPHMLDVINSAKVVDQEERATTLDEMVNTYNHLEHCDPCRDMLMADVDGKMIAYQRLFWEKVLEGPTCYYSFGFLAADWRRMGIGTAMLAWAEERLSKMAAEQTGNGERFFQSGASSTQPGMIALLEKFGYQPVRFEFEMKRSIYDPLPEAPMPAGLEVRPVTEEHYSLIWDAMSEAFKDHWGFVPPTETNYQQWLGEKSFQPDIWKVAWDGDQVAGMVLNFIDSDENWEYDRKRGYTEGISVRRPWRKKGLARSLIVQSIHMFKEMGMSETALGVDSENLSGALKLYQGVGYRKTKQYTVYRKPLD